MKTTNKFFGLVLYPVIVVGLSLTITGRRGSSTSGKSSPLRSHFPSSPATRSMRTTIEATAQPQIAAAYGKLPLSFDENRGQSDPRVKFLARGRGYGLFLTSTEAILSLSHAIAASVSGPASARSQAAGKVKPVRIKQDSAQQKTASLWMSLVGANSAARVTGLDELSGKANYFLGNDPRKWHTNVRTYARVKYENAYPAVDLIYYGNQQDLESDFVVAPGTDPRAIGLKFRGAKSIETNRDGDLLLKIRGGETLLRRPVAYQWSRNGKSPVAARYVLKGAREVAFAVESHDTTEPLIIDPVLAYSTYLGGSGADQAWGIAVDAAGNAYVTGSTSSIDFPTANPFQGACTVCTNDSTNFDAFVTKLSAAGDALVYSTYLGGSAGAWAQSIAVDATGNVYMTGNTHSPDFPMANPFQANLRGGVNAFVTKLSAAGDALAYSTYLGGSSPVGDFGFGIAVDTGGNAYVTGVTSSVDFPLANSFQSKCVACSSGGTNAFVTQFTSTGNTLVYSTYLGGSVVDSGSGIPVDPLGNPYVAGRTVSPDFPTVNAFQATYHTGNWDSFVSKISAAPDFAVTSSSASQTISAGQTTTYPLALTGSSGFSGTVSLKCSGAPPPHVTEG